MNPQDTIGQEVVMGLQVTRRRADVHPVCSLWNVRKEWLAFLQQSGKQAVLERMIFATRDQIEHLRLEHISAGIDVLTGGFIRLWLFQKAAHAAISFGFDDSIRAWVFNRSQYDSRERFAFFVL